MVELVVCKKDSYFDSVTLMTLSSKLKKLPGVGDAVVSMATTMNKELLENVGMLKGEAVDVYKRQTTPCAIAFALPVSFWKKISTILTITRLYRLRSKYTRLWADELPAMLACAWQFPTIFP